MTNSNRVPRGVPTGGEFATGAKAENDDLAVSTPEPAPLTPKKLHRWAGDPKTEVTVQLRELNPGYNLRRVEVLNDKGELLGTVYKFKSRIDTKIKGTRMVRHGKEREFWSCSTPGEESSNSWMKMGSQAEAIRRLISSKERLDRGDLF